MVNAVGVFAMAAATAVAVVLMAAPVAHADQGTATFYTPPYVRKYFLTTKTINVFKLLTRPN